MLKVNAADINGFDESVKWIMKNLIKLRIISELVMHHSNVLCQFG